MPRCCASRCALIERSDRSRGRKNFSRATKSADERNRDRLMLLFEMVRAAQASLTSCAWFFDDFGGLEGRVVLRWAARAVELAAEFAAEYRARAAPAAAPNPIESARDRRRGDAVLESQNARGAREDLAMATDTQGHDIESVLERSAKISAFRRVFAAAHRSRASTSTKRCAAAPNRIRKNSGASARDELAWFKPYDKVLEWNFPFAKWFVGGKINASYNCLDRHLTDGAAQQGRAHLGRRAGRLAHADLSDARR